MKINQAEELAGITKKNIRFYEEQGLIRPGRDPGNGYREYTLSDVEQLKRVKLLRSLDVPCEKIREMTEGKLSLKKCMVDEAEAISADAIVGVRYGSSQIMQGAAEVIAYGTAVRFIEK